MREPVSARWEEVPTHTSQRERLLWGNLLSSLRRSTHSQHLLPGESPNGEFMSRLCGQLLELLKGRDFLTFSWNFFWRILNIRKYTLILWTCEKPKSGRISNIYIRRIVNIIFHIRPIMTNIIFAWQEYENRTWIQICS